VADITATNVKALNRALDAIDPSLKKAMVKDIKQVAKPLQLDIKKAIPPTSPLRGSYHQGRTGWGVGVRADTVKINYRTSGSRRTAITPLVKLSITSPLTSILDMAGRAGGQARPMSRYYTKNGRRMRHKVTTQGRSMLARLGRNPSRYGWAAVEDNLPGAGKDIQAILDRESKRISRKFD